MHFGIINVLLESKDMKIITYNVWYGYLDRKHGRLPCLESGSKRKELIYYWLKEQNADIVVFQELIDYSAERLKIESAFWGHKHAVTLRDEGMAIGISSKYPLTIYEILTDGMHHGMIYCNTGGIDIIATHLWPSFDETILDEVMIVKQRANKSLHPGISLIVLGDFNAFSPEDDRYVDEETMDLYTNKWRRTLENGRPNYRVIGELLDVGLKDICVQFDKNNMARKQRDDFIFVSSDLAQNCVDATHTHDKEFLKLSDHYPIVAQFELSR